MTLEPTLPQIPGTPAVLVVLGLLLVFFGRRLFYLVLAAAGFLLGFSFAVRFLEGVEPWIALGAGLVTGLVAAGLAMFVQRAAVGIAGFLVGGYAALSLVGQYSLLPAHLDWVGFVVGGVVGAGLVSWLFEWALIGASALFGGLLVVQGAGLSPALSLAVWVTLFFVGALFQLGRRKRRRRTRRTTED